MRRQVEEVKGQGWGLVTPIWKLPTEDSPPRREGEDGEHLNKVCFQTERRGTSVYTTVSVVTCHVTVFSSSVSIAPVFLHLSVCFNHETEYHM